MSKAYKEVLEYLIQHSSLENPLSAQEIADGTNVSKPSVFRLLQSKFNGATPDETISPGIFLAPETMSINGGRAARQFYADPKRIQDKRTLSEMGVDKVPVRIDFTQFFVQPITITPSILEGFKAERDVINTVMETPGKPMPEVLLAITTAFENIYEAFPKWYDDLNKQRAAAQENWEQVQLGEDTLDKDLHQKFKEQWSGVYKELIRQATLLRIVMQHPYFDTAPQKLFSEDTRKPEVVPPVVKEIS